MIKYNVTSPKKHFLLLNIHISINCQSSMVFCYHDQSLSKQENIIATNLAVINAF